jgi:uncharacterized protein YjbI with pentapeptide repeats
MMAIIALFVLVSMSLATFPGEPHVNLFTGNSPFSVQCDRWVAHHYDRLILPSIDIVDDDKLEKIEKATKAAGERPDQGERTQKLRGRDLNCGDFSDGADLRRVDLTGAQLRGASLRSVKLQGASLNDAKLQGASLNGAQLQGAFLNRAQLQGSSLESAQLQGASLDSAQFQRASLARAKLQEASLNSANFNGANLEYALLLGVFLVDTEFQGAVLDHAQLYAAYFKRAKLQGVSFVSAGLQGAIFDDVNLRGASFARARLQGSGITDNSNLSLADFSYAFLWHTARSVCDEFLANNTNLEPIVGNDIGNPGKYLDATSEGLETLITRILEQGTLEQGTANFKNSIRKTLQQRLSPTFQKESTSNSDFWQRCAENVKDKYQEKLANYLVDLACNDDSIERDIATGIARNRVIRELYVDDTSGDLSRPAANFIARSLLGLDGKTCPGADKLDAMTKEQLKKIVAARAN